MITNTNMYVPAAHRDDFESLRIAATPDNSSYIVGSNDSVVYLGTPDVSFDTFIILDGENPKTIHRGAVYDRDIVNRPKVYQIVDAVIPTVGSLVVYTQEEYDNGTLLLLKVRAANSPQYLTEVTSISYKQNGSTVSKKLTEITDCNGKALAQGQYGLQALPGDTTRRPYVLALYEVGSTILRTIESNDKTTELEEAVDETATIVKLNDEGTIDDSTAVKAALHVSLNDTNLQSIRDDGEPLEDLGVYKVTSRKVGKKTVYSIANDKEGTYYGFLSNFDALGSVYTGSDSEETNILKGCDFIIQSDVPIAQAWLVKYQEDPEDSEVVNFVASAAVKLGLESLDTGDKYLTNATVFNNFIKNHIEASDSEFYSICFLISKTNIDSASETPTITTGYGYAKKANIKVHAQGEPVSEISTQREYHINGSNLKELVQFFLLKGDVQMPRLAEPHIINGQTFDGRQDIAININGSSWDAQNNTIKAILPYAIEEGLAGNSIFILNWSDDEEISLLQSDYNSNSRLKLKIYQPDGETEMGTFNLQGAYSYRTWLKKDPAKHIIYIEGSDAYCLTKDESDHTIDATYLPQITQLDIDYYVWATSPLQGSEKKLLLDHKRENVFVNCVSLNTNLFVTTQSRFLKCAKILFKGSTSIIWGTKPFTYELNKPASFDANTTYLLTIENNIAKYEY